MNPRRLDRRGKRFALVASRFNELVTERLVAGARAVPVAARRRRGRRRPVWVPGCLGAARSPRAGPRAMDATTRIVALGCVIRGETPHFDYVAGEAAKGLAALALDADLPVALRPPHDRRHRSGARRAPAARAATRGGKPRSRARDGRPLPVSSGPAVRERSRARGWALQVLYAWESRASDPSPIPVLHEFLHERRIAESSRRAYLRELVRAVADHREAIDARLQEALTNWRLERLCGDRPQCAAARRGRDALHRGCPAPGLDPGRRSASPRSTAPRRARGS